VWIAIHAQPVSSSFTDVQAWATMAGTGLNGMLTLRVHILHSKDWFIFTGIEQPTRGNMESATVPAGFEKPRRLPL
jgi:hypothetical protein